MKRIKQTLLALAATLLLGLTACQQQELPIDNTRTTLLPDGRLRIPLNLTLPQMDEQQVNTRTTDKNYDERMLTSLYVLVFDAPSGTTATDYNTSDPLLERVQADLNSGTVAITPRTSPVRIWAVANLSATALAVLNGVTTMTELLSMNLPNTVLYTNGSTPGALAPAPYPMSTDGSYHATIGMNTTITTTLRAIYARIDLTSTAPGFTLDGATLRNGAKNGYLIPQPTLSTDPATGGYATYAEKAPTGNLISPLYLYPRKGTGTVPGDNATDLVIRGTYNSATAYYKLRIKYGNADPALATYDINRNTLYKVTITAVSGPGYLTPAEAAANDPANIEYTIDIPDTNASASDLTVTNGQYYLGVDNTEVHYYGAPTGTQTIATLTVGNAAGQALPSAGAARGTITVSGTGFSMVSAAGLLQSAVAGTAYALTGTVAANANATITIRFGDLEKTIVVKSFNALASFAATNIPIPNVTHAEMLVNDNDYLRLSTSAAGYPGSYLSELNTLPAPTTVYLCPPYTVPADRTSSVLLARSGSLGRLRAVVKQTKPIDPGSVATISPAAAYVGAFWRAAQTGERIIRIPTTTTATAGAWDAQVLWMDANWGSDQVLFSTAPSSDPTISYTVVQDAADMNNPANDAAYTVSGGSTTANGTATDGATNYITFRMGISAPNLGTKPRYAVVLLRYGTPQKNHLIYLRQGEQPDYVGGTVVKWSPYNVGNNNDQTEYPYATSWFTAYPSQAGYFKSFSDTYNMWAPHNSTGWVSETAATINNVCPDPVTYSIPTSNGTDGNSGNLTGHTTWTGGNQMGTLFEGTNAYGGSPKNIFGYYADGFFDRHMIVSSANGAVTSAIKTAGSSVAYRGYLYVNTTTNASLFVPAAGFRINNGTLDKAGNYCSYWSSSVYSSFSWHLYFDSATTYQGTAGRTYSFSVRCIRQ